MIKSAEYKDWHTVNAKRATALPIAQHVFRVLRTCHILEKVSGMWPLGIAPRCATSAKLIKKELHDHEQPTD
jgi:hypothetical protein